MKKVFKIMLLLTALTGFFAIFNKTTTYADNSTNTVILSKQELKAYEDKYHLNIVIEQRERTKIKAKNYALTLQVIEHKDDNHKYANLFLINPTSEDYMISRNKLNSWQIGIMNSFSNYSKGSLISAIKTIGSKYKYHHDKVKQKNVENGLKWHIAFGIDISIFIISLITYIVMIIIKESDKIKTNKEEFNFIKFVVGLVLFISFVPIAIILFLCLITFILSTPSNSNFKQSFQ